MNEYRLPMRPLIFAFVFFQTILMVIIGLIFSIIEPGEIVRFTLKILGASAISVFAWRGFRNSLWKHKIFRIIGIVDFPVLDGKWDSVIKYKGHDEVIVGEALVTQSYDALSVRHTGIISTSHSISATLVRNNTDASNFMLIMTVQNVVIRELMPEQQAAGLVEHRDHRSTLILEILGSPPCKMEGRIFSDELSVSSDASHPSFGHVVLKKAS